MEQLKPKPQPKPKTFTQVAREALEEADGDIQAGTDNLVAKVLASQDYRVRFFGKLVRDACYSAISDLVRDERSEIWQAEQPKRKLLHRGMVEALARGVAKTLFDFPLPGGQRLGDATRLQVGDAASSFEDQARTPAREARFLRAVYALLPDDKATVRKAIKLDKLKQLREEASHAND